MTHPAVVGGVNSRRSWREFVVEVNDGIISTAGIVEGMVAADVRDQTVMISVAIALVVGTVTTAGARYSEVAYLRDAAVTAVEEERRQLASSPEAELEELTSLYRDKGLSDDLARQVAHELTSVDALAAHVEEELDLEPEDFRSPWVGTALSAAAYAAGGLLPVIISLLVPYNRRILTTAIAVTIALVITSYVGATVGNTRPARTVLRAVTIGLATLLLAVAVGLSFE